MTCITKACLFLLVAISATAASAVELKLLLPQGRVAYQTNERIAVAVVRTAPQPLTAVELSVTVTSKDGSKLAFSFPLAAAALEGNRTSVTDHFSLNAALLRPGSYTIEAAVGEAAAKTDIEVYSHLRKSSYRVVHWSSGAAKQQQALMGEDGLGYNLLLNSQPPTDDLVRGGLDFMGVCLMGGMHQHDGRAECDWSDPYVTGGAVQRAMVRSYAFRTWGNAIGAHLHDEPGLTWAKHPHTGIMTAADIPAQRAAYQRAFNAEPVWYDQVDANDPASFRQWTRMGDFKLGFMEAFWRQARYGLEKMKPGFLSVTQSQYAWQALADGYYFNVARSMPVICGHGGYSDYGLRTLNPLWYLSFALPRQTEKPTWYLPEWFNMASENYRAEYNVCFATGIQGLCTPPMSPYEPAAQSCTDGIVETNKTFLSLGTIFAKPAISRGDVAILYSKSASFYNMAGGQPNRDNEQWEKLAQLFLATRMTQYPATVVLDEDLVDGTAAASHKAVLLTAIHFLDPAVKAALEGIAAAGGTVLVTDDCTVPIAGAVKLGVAVKSYWEEGNQRVNQIQNLAARQRALAQLNLLSSVAKAVRPLAMAVKSALSKVGIKPAFETDASGLAAARQTCGEIDYLFAINFTPTDDSDMPVAAVEAQVALPSDGRTVYDAIRGGPFAELKAGNKGVFRFGAGQMRVFALASRAIGGVQVSPPTVSADMSRNTNPIVVQFGATLLDGKGGILGGTAPMRVRVIDPLGEVRYDLYRATDQGVLKLSLPLGVNDPAGTWKVAVQEMLGNTQGESSFTYRPAAVCGAIIGSVPRALLFEPDRKTIYEMFQSHKTFTIVNGEGSDVTAAASRLASVLEPYDVHCTIVEAASVKPRELTAAEKKTWTSYGGGAGGPLANGYDLPGPAILIGNPRNNPLVAVVAQAGKWHPDLPSLMPYRNDDLVPGRGRGMIGWHLYLLGRRLETVTLLANDAQGLNEAVGTLLEIVAGMEPLVPATMPLRSSIKPASTPLPKPPEAAVAWQATLPDRAVTIQAEGDGIVVNSLDGSLTTLDANGAIVSQKAGAVPVIGKPVVVDAKTLPKGRAPVNCIPKFTATAGGLTAIGYWGGTLQVFAADGSLKTQQQLPQDIAQLAWSHGKLIVALADGKLVALTSFGSQGR
jgi:hypothetical protein